MQKYDNYLKELFGAYLEEAPKDAAYPYKVISAKRLSESDGIEVWSIECNVWDKNRYYSRAEALMDALEEAVHGNGYFVPNAGLVQIWKGQRQNVPDEDKQIKRVRETFEAHVTHQ